MIGASLALLLVLLCDACETPLGFPATDPNTAAPSPTESPATNEPPQAPPVASQVPDAEPPEELPPDPADCFKLPPFEQAECLGMSDAELVLFLSQDADGDGSSNLMEATNGTDPFDALLGGDIDGDGIQNKDDSDVDGDGEDNSEDSDVDGDNEENGEDDDVDGDGLDVDEDDDDDGDGLDDEDDTDDDGDGEDDCGCEHGTCSSFGGLCFCEEGWKGEDCDEFHCNDVRNCNNGTCVGPNTCRCNPGWNSVGSIPCAQFNCLGVRNCSGHGTCIGANACDCDAAWKGKPDCSSPTCKVDASFCNDSNNCTQDTCESDGCHHELICQSPLECISGQCAHPCTTASDCPDDEQACRNGGCFDCTNNRECNDFDPCTIDSCNSTLGKCNHTRKTCFDFEACVRGECVTNCLTDPDACEGEGRKCQGGGCFEECGDDGECDNDDEVCEGGACVPVECQDDGDCEPPQTCEDGVCKSP